jgi:hypothetical protein
MTQEEAISIARHHLENNPFPDDEYRWVLGPATPTRDGWYFDYRYEPIAGLGELPPYAGAMGFLVSADRGVRDLSFSAWQKLFPSG